MSNQVDVDEHDQHCHQADERHQHCRAQSCIDVWDEAPRGATDRSVSVCFFLSVSYTEKEEIHRVKEINVISYITCPYCSVFTLS